FSVGVTPQSVLKNSHVVTPAATMVPMSRPSVACARPGPESSSCWRLAGVVLGLLYSLLFDSAVAPTIAVAVARPAVPAAPPMNHPWDSPCEGRSTTVGGGARGAGGRVGSVRATRRGGGAGAGASCGAGNGPSPGLTTPTGARGSSESPTAGRAGAT